MVRTILAKDDTVHAEVVMRGTRRLLCGAESETDIVLGEGAVEEFVDCKDCRKAAGLKERRKRRAKSKAPAPIEKPVGSGADSPPPSASPQLEEAAL